MPPARAARSAAHLITLSTSEKNDISKDPAVQAVVGRFGGSVEDIRRDTAVPPPEPDTEPGSDAGEET